MIKAIFFDFDGVLTTDPTGTTSIINYIKKFTDVDHLSFERAYRKHNYHLLYGLLTHEKIWPTLCSDLDKELDMAVLYDSFAATPLDKEIFALAKDLKQRGSILGIITDNKRDRIDIISRKAQLWEIFDSIVVSSDVGSGKKSREIFDRALLGLELEFEQCVFIDNNRENLVVPARLGMKTLYFDHEVRDTEGLKAELRGLLGMEMG